VKLDAAVAIAALGARTIHPELVPDMLEIVTDTRLITGGQTFLALRGDNFDGHAFVAQAFERGARACIVDDATSIPADRPGIVVQKTLQAYLALGRLARRKLAGRIVAISGSAGKTTTKSFLLQLLTAAGVPATATPENENNEIGVSKFLLSLDENDTRIAIVEMGARRYRDLDVLVDAAQPDVAILTNIGEAHLEIFGSHERLAETKWGLFRRHARAVLPLGDDAVRTRAGKLEFPALWFGIGKSKPPTGEPGVILTDAHHMVVHDGIARTTLTIEVNVPGDHNILNAAAAVAGAVALGCSPAALAPFIADLRLPHGRYETLLLADGGRVIFDAYNASMSGTLATLRAFASETGRRIAVLGSMAELGIDSPQMHRRVGAAAVKGSEVILAGGEFANDIAQGAEDAGASPESIVRYADNEEAIAWLKSHRLPGDAILLKGSRKYKMEQIAAGLGAEAMA
jgi:UDP-N-acetylmuramoyl-tripeptide--D-alanyl-D-alanine ligase